jgi:DNA polymerase III sliding clamp (beta) subunit (PCNA family)
MKTLLHKTPRWLAPIFASRDMPPWSDLLWLSPGAVYAADMHRVHFIETDDFDGLENPVGIHRGWLDTLATLEHPFILDDDIDRIVFTTEEESFVIPVLDFDSPQWREKIPGENKVSAQFEIEAGTLKTALKTLRKKDASIVIHVTHGGGRVSLRSNSPGSRPRPIETISGLSKDDTEVAVSVQYLLDAIDLCGVEFVSVKLYASHDPIVIRTKENFTAVIAPMEIIQ